ncbi:hypothetical protein BE11_45900 [Sorangium cellulosum]|nr:hypothetical protein BE11_45900 [Sorangium cellulosum]
MVRGGSAALTVAVTRSDDFAVAGGTVNSGITASILRLLPDGSLDAGFGTSGAVVLEDHPDQNDLYAVAVQRDGCIVAAGKRSNLGLMVVRVWD